MKPALWSPLIPAADPGAAAGHADGHLAPDRPGAVATSVTGAKSSHYGLGGVIHGAAVIFFAYIGFEAVSTAGAESKNPARDMPIGILGSLVICTILYIATCAVLVGIVPYAQLDGPAPIATAVNHIGITWFAELVKIGAIAGLSSVMLVLLYGQTRIFYTMSHDGLLPLAAGGRAQALQDALDQHHHRRGGGGRVRGLPVAGHPLGGDQRRHAGRLHHRLRHGDLPARHAPEDGAAVPHAALSVRADPGRAHVPGAADEPDGRAGHRATSSSGYMAGGVVVYFAYGLWNSKLGRGIATRRMRWPAWRLRRRSR